MLSPTQFLSQVRRLLTGAKPHERGVDVRSLKPTPPLTEHEKRARYEQGRTAEMSERDAGL